MLFETIGANSYILSDESNESGMKNQHLQDRQNKPMKEILNYEVKQKSALS